MNRLNLSDSDWLKLSEYNNVIANKIKKQLPVDWQMSLEDIKSAVYDTIIKLGSIYKEGSQSFLSYCYQYACQYTYRDLIREYKRLKHQETLDALYNDDLDDSQPCRHRYGEAEVKALSVDERNTVADKIQVNELLEKMPKIDRMIAKLILKGYSYDDIVKELGFDNKMQIVRRMQKYKGMQQ